MTVRRGDVLLCIKGHRFCNIKKGYLYVSLMGRVDGWVYVQDESGSLSLMAHSHFKTVIKA